MTAIPARAELTDYIHALSVARLVRHPQHSHLRMHNPQKVSGESAVLVLLEIISSYATIISITPQ